MESRDDQRYAPFNVLRNLGSGRFGDTYLAHDQCRPEHLLVIKVPNFTAQNARSLSHVEAAQLLRSEAAFMCELHHPNLVRYREFVVPATGNYENFLVVEYASGGSLGRLLEDRKAPLAAEEASRVLLNVLEALDYLHMKGVCHLGIKPSNILYTSGRSNAMLADYGLNRFVGFETTSAYVSPEARVQGPLAVTTKADVWSVGVLLYEMVAGKTPALADIDPETDNLARNWTLLHLSPSMETLFGPLIRLMLTVDADARPSCSMVLSHPALAPLKQLVAKADALKPRALNQLPPRPVCFVGRQAELDRLRGLDPAIGTTVLTGLRGMGGVGKTALALILAHEWAPYFPDAQLYMDARGMQVDPCTADSLMTQVIHAFQPTLRLPDDSTELQKIFRQTLVRKRVLLLIDNARDVSQVAPLLPLPSCAIIVTSRNSFMLGPRPALSVGQLQATDAQLLLRTFYPTLSDNDAATLAKLCGGLPLALRIAGSHLALEAEERGGLCDVQGYISRLASGRLRELDADASGSGDVTISETIRLSEELLSREHVVAWRKLGAFTAGFNARAALAVAGADIGLLERLIGCNMLMREGDDRFRLHDMAASYVRIHIGPEVHADLCLNHVKHFIQVARESQNLYKNGETIRALSLFDAERTEIEGAYKWLAQRGMDSSLDLVALANAIVHTGSLRFHARTQLIPWLSMFLSAARVTHNRSAECCALGNLGNAYSDLGDTRKSLEYFEQALAISRDIGDRCSESDDLGNIGTAHSALGDVFKAIDYYEQALSICRDVGDKRREATDLGNLGNAYTTVQNVEKAIECYTRALMLSREHGDKLGESNHLGNLGIARAALGEYELAINCYEQSLALSREIGDRQGEANDLTNLGNAYAALDLPTKAIDLYKEALIISRDIGNRRGESADLTNLGTVYSDVGDSRAAITCYENAWDLVREVGDRRGEAVVLGNLGSAYHAIDDDARAVEFFSEALRISRELRDRQGEGEHLDGLGVAYGCLGNTSMAVEHYEQALLISRELGNRSDESVRLGHLGIAHADMGHFESAVSSYEAAIQICRECGNESDESNHLGNLGILHADSGDYLAAIDCHERSLCLSREIGDRNGEKNDLKNLGDALAAAKEFQRAAECYAGALNISKEISDHTCQLEYLEKLGLMHGKIGDSLKAIEFYEQALRICRDIDDTRAEGSVLGNIGNCYMDIGNHESAIVHYEQSLSCMRSINDRAGEGQCLGNLANAHAASGNDHLALKIVDLGIEIFRELGDNRSESIALQNSSSLLWRNGEGKAAIRNAVAALRLLESQGYSGAQELRKTIEMWEVEERLRGSFPLSCNRGVHPSVSCDGCRADPLVGPRFNCSICQNYDLCAVCYARNVALPGSIHDISHAWNCIAADSLPCPAVSSAESELLASCATAMLSHVALQSPAPVNSSGASDDDDLAAALALSMMPVQTLEDEAPLPSESPLHHLQ